ncbi:hypothetical protein J6590_052113 [Homalodisca vitripennis]|nr:hypothetical protein J6590_052113 [Homalodisca vitripennis]
MSLASCDLYRIRSYYAVLPTPRAIRFSDQQHFQNGLDLLALLEKKLTRACKVQAQIKRRSFCTDKIRRVENAPYIGRSGLKVTSEPPPTTGQAECFQGQDRSAVTHPSSSHARRCLIWLYCNNRRTLYTAPLAVKEVMFTFPRPGLDLRSSDSSRQFTTPPVPAKLTHPRPSRARHHRLKDKNTCRGRSIPTPSLSPTDIPPLSFFRCQPPFSHCCQPEFLQKLKSFRGEQVDFGTCQQNGVFTNTILGNLLSYQDHNNTALDSPMNRGRSKRRAPDGLTDEDSGKLDGGELLVTSWLGSAQFVETDNLYIDQNITLARTLESLWWGVVGDKLAGINTVEETDNLYINKNITS